MSSLMDPAVFWKVCKIKTLITVVFMSTNSVLAMNTKKIWMDVETNQFYFRHSDRALKILKIRHFDKKMNEEDRFYNIVCKDFLHSFQLDFYPPTLGYLPPPQLFSSSYLPSYACKFQCLLTRKIHNFRADFLVVFVDCIGFYYQKKSSTQVETPP